MFRNYISLNCIFSAFLVYAISADSVEKAASDTELFLYISIFCVGIICRDEL